MKRKKSKYFVIAVCYLLFISCADERRFEINDAEAILGIKLNRYSIKSLNIQKEQLYIDYTRPYNIYIAVGTNKSDADSIFHDLGMIKYDSVNIVWMDTLLCLFNKPLDLSKWDVEPMEHKNEALKHQQKIRWWHPDVKKSRDNYFLYYKITSQRGKVVKCYEDNNGRIVGQYSRKQQKMYFLIEINP